MTNDESQIPSLWHILRSEIAVFCFVVFIGGICMRLALYVLNDFFGLFLGAAAYFIIISLLSFLSGFMRYIFFGLIFFAGLIILFLPNGIIDWVAIYSCLLLSWLIVPKRESIND